MFLRLHKLAVTAALAGLVSAGGVVLATPAAASTTYLFTADGDGTIFPGLTQIPTYQTSITWDGTVNLFGADGSRITATATFRGSSSIPETIQVGSGAGNLTGDLTGQIAYERVGGIVVLAGTVDVHGSAHVIGQNRCQFVPTTFNPITTYRLACVGELH